jgi:taurine dioxygenase
MQKLLEGLNGVHTPDRAFGAGGTIGSKQSAQIAENNIKVLGEAVHPLVRTHPETGRKALFVNRSFTRGIEGMSQDESAAILDFLFRHLESPDFQVRFRWREGSVAFWDNRCTVHRVMNDFGGQKRLLFRTTIEGDRPH